MHESQNEQLFMVEMREWRQNSINFQWAGNCGAAWIHINDAVECRWVCDINKCLWCHHTVRSPSFWLLLRLFFHFKCSWWKKILHCWKWNAERHIENLNLLISFSLLTSTWTQTGYDYWQSFKARKKFNFMQIS